MNRWIALDCCEGRRLSPNVFFGDTYGIEILRGHKFRRQHPFDDYVLDFYCPNAKLAIELDGGGHNYRTGQIRDRTRSEFLARHGVVVLRFWNIRFAKSSIACCEQSGSHSRSDSKTIPHLHPLVAPPGRDPKGEATSNGRN